MNRLVVYTWSCAICACMPVHDVTLGADEPRIMVADAGDVQSADATIRAPDRPDPGSATDAAADAASSDATSYDAMADSSSADAARRDAARPTNSSDGGDAGKPHDDDDDHIP